MLGSVGGEPANDAQLASEIDEFIDLLITQGERSMMRPSDLPALSFSPFSFAERGASATASKFLVLGDDEQQQQQQQQREKQHKRREGQGRQQGVYVCSRINCRKRFERPNALRRHIVSIHDCTGVLCPFCASKRRKFNRSDNFTRCVPTCPTGHPFFSIGDGGDLLGC